MSSTSQIPRYSIFWLLSAQLAVILPHTPRMSAWMIAIWLLCAIWRIAMFRGQAGIPGKFLRALLVVMGCIGVGISFGNLGGLDIAVALLILAFSLKLIEVRERRDLYLVFYLAFFIIAAAFLFSQSLLLAIYQIFSVVFVLTAMVATQYSLTSQKPARALSVAIRLVAQAVPLMLVFFVVFPRIGPIWSVPNSDATAGTGMSDSMSPGDVSKLNQSDELAFRVTFNDAVPAREKLYWRGMTLAHFDGRTWTRESYQKRLSELGQQRDKHFLFGDPVIYSVIVEPTQQHWLFTLPVASQPGNKTGAIETVPTADYSLASMTKLIKRRNFRFESYLDYKIDTALSAEKKQLMTDIPANYNPRAADFARQLRSRMDSSEAFIRELQAIIQQQDFYYTLEPPQLGMHSIDEFFFDTRQGYCEHYASAFTFMLRAAGIPARVVVGYQGGEINELNGTLSVRQMDAHAWLEFWQAGSGWQRLDPTASIAPERIKYGMQEALARSSALEVGLLSPLYYRNMALVKAIRMRLEAANFAWYKWVVGFDNKSQANLLKNLLGDVTPGRTALLVAVVLALTLGVAAYLVMKRPGDEKTRKELQLYRKFCHKMRAMGLERKASEAPTQFAARIIQLHPALTQEVQGITEQYISIAYNNDIGSESVERLKKMVRKFRPTKQR